MAGSVPEQIAENIRARIVRGSLAPGGHLRQIELVKEFSTSRGPVREALKLLAAQGLVAHDPNRGFFITEMSEREVSQLYRLRLLVESELIATMPWPDATQLAALEQLIEQCEDALRQGKRWEWVLRLRAFHTALFNLSDAEVIVRECLRLWMLTDRYRSLLPGPDAYGDRETGPTDERRLMDALVKRDRPALLKILQDDLHRVENLILDILRNRFG